MSASTQSRVHVYTPEQQGSGSFDGGRITEIKPIGFSGDGSVVRRIGPLFYWAWATANGSSSIAMHPHKGFEIASYVLSGELSHRDTGGNSSRVGAGGVQLMQTGSGISHREDTNGPTEFFQIWFEPDLPKALRRSPEYHEASADQMLVVTENGATVKAILGGASHIQIEADATLEHWTLPPGSSRQITVAAGYSLALVVVRGEPTMVGTNQRRSLQPRDFVVVNGTQASDDALSISVANDASSANGDDGTTETQIVAVQVPAEVDYQLLAK